MITLAQLTNSGKESKQTSRTMRLQIDQLLMFIEKNHIVMKEAICLGLDSFSLTIVSEVCQMNQVHYTTWDCSAIKKIKREIRIRRVDTLFYKKKDVKFVNNLLWECNELLQSICVDTENIEFETDGKSKLMNKKLWDYTANNACDDIEGGGWINSYTREKFTKQEMNEYVENIISKISVYLDNSKRVLEIGCASGLTMYALSPYVSEYIALDMSSCMIRKNYHKIRNEGLKNIKLYCLYAHDLPKIREGKFDIGIMNSVVHCFEGHLYFKRIIRMLIDKMNDYAVIFLGDIMDAEKKNEFEHSLLHYKEIHNAKTKVDLSQELFLSKKFIQDLFFDFPEIEQILISNKEGKIENELTKYRYDVILKLNKTLCNQQNRQRNKLQYSCELSQDKT